MRTRRWMDWTPKKLGESPETEPTKPTEPSFEGFDGSSLAPFAKIAVLAPLPSRGFVPLKGGLVLPVEVFELVLDLERRGIPLATDGDHRFIVPNDSRLTETDYVAIRRWKHHIGAAIEYRAPEVG